ncbi:hypothetical protein ACN47E_006566 [Coniothyrium glycines]
MAHADRDIADLEKFFTEDVENLSDEYYINSGTECVICKSDAEADQPTTADSICNRAVVKIKACNHIFHKLCLYTWFQSQLARNEEATCPMCRRTLIERISHRLIRDLGRTVELQRTILRTMFQNVQLMPEGSEERLQEEALLLARYNDLAAAFEDLNELAVTHGIVLAIGG